MSDDLVREIRCARADEIDALEDIQRRASSIWEEYRDLIAAYPDAVKLSPDAVAQERVRIAVGDGDEPLGFSIVLTVSDGVCELEGLFVTPDHMRAGIGRALLADVQRRARLAGARELQLTSGPGSVLFYERAGFELGDPVQTRFGLARRMRRTLRSGADQTAHG